MKKLVGVVALVAVLLTGAKIIHDLNQEPVVTVEVPCILD